MATGRVPTTANSPLTAKGDLFTYSTAPARLAVGNSGEQIVADASTSTGLRYTAGNPISNPVINSAMQVWQRGTTFAISNTTTYTADRWQGRVTSACTTSFSRQATGDTTNLPNIQYCTRVQRANGQTATPFLVLEQSFETINSIAYSGKTVTFSFYARAGANYSATSSVLNAVLKSGTGTDQNAAVTYTGEVSVVGASATLTTTWQRFTYTGTVPTNSTELGIVFYYTATGTAGAADYFEVTGVQIDIGSVALPFRTYAGTIQGEYSACQRYYQRITAGQNFYRFGLGTNVSATQAGIVVPFKTSMRTTPTFTASGNFDTVEGTTSRGTNAPTLSSDGNNTESAFIFTSIASATTGYSVQLRSSNNVNSYIDFSAEL